MVVDDKTRKLKAVIKDPRLDHADRQVQRLQHAARRLLTGSRTMKARLFALPPPPRSPRRGRPRAGRRRRREAGQGQGLHRLPRQRQEAGRPGLQGGRQEVQGRRRRRGEARGEGHQGRAGRLGPMPMPPNKVTPDEAKQLVAYVLAM